MPGIGFSPDKMLQGRLSSYGDAQRYRLGVNHHLIPGNSSRCPFHSYHRDGAMRVDGNHGNTARAMGDAPREIKIRHIGNCLKADAAYGKKVAGALDIPLSQVEGA